jgi:F-type H+-transporting ATPase subunit epsilon
MAIPANIELEIVTPDRPVARHVVDEVVVPGINGYFGVLPGHAPMLAALSVGELWYRVGQEKTYVSIALGFAEVQPDRVTILAKLAERADEIDVDRAEAARKRAEERLAHSKGDIDYERARIALSKSIARIHVAQIHGGSLRRIREQASRG